MSFRTSCIFIASDCRKKLQVYVLIKVLRMSNSSFLILVVKVSFLLPIYSDAKCNMLTNLLSFCFSEMIFLLIQQEIFMVKEWVKHCNIVAYFGSYLRWKTQSTNFFVFHFLPHIPSLSCKYARFVFKF